MMKKNVFGMLLMVSVLICGCSREKTIEAVSVSEKDVSVPDESVPIVKEVQQQEQTVLDSQYIWRVDEKSRIYGAVVPVNSKEISVTEKETRIYVPSMGYRQIETFVNKYFPYQEIATFNNTNIITVRPKIKDEFSDGRIIPDLNVNVFKPDIPVYIKIYPDHDLNAFVWIYHDPNYNLQEAKKYEEQRKEADIKQAAEWEKERDARLRNLQDIDVMAVLKNCQTCEMAKSSGNALNIQNICSECRNGALKLSPEDIKKYNIKIPE